MFTFTGSYETLSYQLTSGVKLAPYQEPSMNIPHENWVALWDTGATQSCISEKAIRTYNLIPISYACIKTSQGKHDVACYYVSMFLPNGVSIPRIQVLGGIFDDFDVLIGMDIIGLGDFAVSNFGGKTVFSFRMPSMTCFDFVNNWYFPSPIKKP